MVTIFNPSQPITTNSQPSTTNHNQSQPITTNSQPITTDHNQFTITDQEIYNNRPINQEIQLDSYSTKYSHITYISFAQYPTKTTNYKHITTTTTQQDSTLQTHKQL